MDHLSPFMKLRNLLAKVYADEASIRRVVVDATLASERINFNRAALNLWQDILIEAAKTQKTPILLNVLLDEYGSNSEIRQICEEYQYFLDQGGEPKIDGNYQEPGVTPYQGLHYFDVGDADRFFGRESLTTELIDHIRQQSFLTIIGASGSGKSSVVRAGVVATLQRGDLLTGSERWPIYIITPTAHPLKSLALSLTRTSESVTAAKTLMDDLAQDATSLDLYVTRLLTGQSCQRLVLVIDQFEELFTLCKDKRERTAFVENLLHAAAVKMTATSADMDYLPQTTVILLLRADFYHRCAEFAGLRAALERYQRYIGPMNATELRRAIEKPASQSDWRFEEGLVDEILRDLGVGEKREAEPGALPLLSHALRETWERRRGRTMTYIGYHETGGVHGAIATTAERLFTQQLTVEQRILAKNIFLRLTELGEGSQDTRRRVARQELLPSVAAMDSVEKLITILADARLITTFADEAEVAHEALIREWPRLQEWLADNRVGLRLHRQLTTAAQQWQDHGCDASYLYSGSRLVQAMEWADQHHTELNESEQRFLAAGKEAEHMATRDRRWKIVILTMIGMAAIVFAVIAGTIGLYSSNQASDLRSRELAANARLHLESDPELSVMLARQALLDEKYTIEAESMLREALQTSRVLTTFSHGITDNLYKVAFTDDGRRVALADAAGKVEVRSVSTGELLTTWVHSATVTTMAFNPRDSALLATGDVSGTVLLWDIDTKVALPPIEHKDQVYSLAFHPQQNWLVTSSRDGTVRVWDIVQQIEVEEVSPIHDLYISSMTFSPDGAYLIAGDYWGYLYLWNGNITQWNPEVAQNIYSWQGHTGAVLDLAFAPDEQMFTTVGQDRIAKLWKVANIGAETPLYELEGHDSTVLDIVFSATGHCVATTSYDKTTVLWHVVKGKQLTLAGHKRAIFGATFLPVRDRMVLDSAVAPCGQALATVSDDGTLRHWNIGASYEYMTLMGHKAAVRTLAFDPQGRYLASADLNGEVKLWLNETYELNKDLTSPHAILDIAFSADGNYLAMSGKDGFAKIWNVDNAEEQLLVGQDGEISTVLFHPNGEYVFTGGDDGAVYLWERATGKLLTKRWQPHTKAINALSVSYDGTTLATASDDHSAKVWQIEIREDKTDPITLLSPALLKIFPADDKLYHTVFSLDEQQLVSTDANGMIRLDSLLADHHFAINAHAGPAHHSAFHPNGELLATSGADGRAIIWRLANGRLQSQSILTGNMAHVNLAQFSLDGKYLATAGDDGTVRIYLVDADDLVNFARTRITRSWTEAECLQYFQRNHCSIE